MVILPACQPVASAKELSTIRYGGQLYPEEFLLAGDSQLWADQGIKVEHTLFSSGTENNQALISGAVDINIGSDSKTVPLMIAMPDQAVIIGVSQRGDRYSTLVKNDSPYQSWTDLKGKTVGINLTTGSEQVVRRYFQDMGIQWEDYNWVNMKNENMIAALTDGKIEAFTAWEPTPAVAEAQGVGRVIMSYGDVALTPVLIHTTKKYASEHHDEIVRFLAAHLKKAALIKSDPKKAAELAVKAATEKGTKVSAEAFEKIFKRIDFSITMDDSVIAAIKDTAQFLVDQKQVDKIPEIVYDKSFLEEAQKMVNGK
jgi:sulfonate transport system substrate-binding protein